MTNIERSGNPFGVPDAGDFHCGRCGTLLDGGTDEPVAARDLRQQLAGAVGDRGMLIAGLAAAARELERVGQTRAAEAARTILSTHGGQ